MKSHATLYDSSLKSLQGFDKHMSDQMMWMMQAEAKLDTHMELMREQQENLKNNQNNQNQKPEHDEKLKAVHRQIKVCENDTQW